MTGLIGPGQTDLYQDDHPMRTIRNLVCGAAMTAMLATAASPALAGTVTIIGNNSGTPNNLANIGEGLTSSVTFKMGSTSYNLADAELLLRLNAPASNAPLLELTNGNGKVLETLTTPKSLATGDNLITFTAASPFTLEAGQTYSLLLTSSTMTGAYFNWLGGNPAVTPTGPGATYVSTTANKPLTFQLDGTAIVPEPSTLLMSGLSAFAVVGFVRLRRRRLAS